jgi:hypothetical protein
MVKARQSGGGGTCTLTLGVTCSKKRKRVDALADEIALAAAHIDAATHDLPKAIRASMSSSASTPRWPRGG